jgi:hypothetical protein
MSSKKKPNNSYKDAFLLDLNSFIEKIQSRKYESTTCDDVFGNSDSYQREKIYLGEINANKFTTSTDRGNALENLVKCLFSRIDVLTSVSVTRKKTTLGQIDIQISTIQDFIYDIWGMSIDKPEVTYIIGECKNYTKPVGKDEIERICWRASKGRCLTFFIATQYTEDATDEIGHFNSNRHSILINHKGVYVIPISISMIEIIVEHNINFCYFLRWAISNSKMMSINNYLKLT